MLKLDLILQITNQNAIPLIEGKNKKIFGLIKEQLGGKNMTKFVGLRGKIYRYLTDDSSEDKKAKSTKK